MIELLLKTKWPAAETQHLHHIEEATHRLKTHIENILGVTRLVQWVKEGQALVCDETVNVWAELEAVTALQEPLMSERALYLDLVVAADVPTAIKSNIKAIREIFSTSDWQCREIHAKRWHRDLVGNRPVALGARVTPATSASITGDR
ncbi:MAG: hypothetical protein R3F44_18865 [Candidatus Competibacteraceae bacterium]